MRLVIKRTVLLLFAAVVLLAAGSQVNIAREEPPPVELDHVFVFVEKGAPEAKLLKDWGLTVGDKPYRHVGAGTASIGVFFENGYLELVWVEDVDELRAKEPEMVTRAGWKETGASPFGIGLHHRAGSTAPIPFPVRNYSAEWMRPGTFIEVAEGVSVVEPAVFIVPDYMAVGPDEKQQELLKKDPEFAKLFQHPVGVKSITSATITVTPKTLGAAALNLTRGNVVRIQPGAAPLLELTFDGGSRGKSLDARPTLPLFLRY